MTGATIVKKLIIDLQSKSLAKYTQKQVVYYFGKSIDR